MATWLIMIGDVRRVVIEDHDEGVVWATLVRHNGVQTRWRVTDKRLADLTRAAAVSSRDVLVVLYDVLTPGRRAWLTRLLSVNGTVVM